MKWRVYVTIKRKRRQTKRNRNGSLNKLTTYSKRVYVGRARAVEVAA